VLNDGTRHQVFKRLSGDQLAEEVAGAVLWDRVEGAAMTPGRGPVMAAGVGGLQPQPQPAQATAADECQPRQHGEHQQHHQRHARGRDQRL